MYNVCTVLYMYNVHVQVHTCIYMYMKIHVYSTLARLVVKEEKKENPDPIHHTQTIQTQNTHVWYM